MGNINNFEDFYANNLIERFNRLPKPSEGKVKKISFRIFGRYIEAYAGYDENGSYLRLDEENWDILNKPKIKKVKQNVFGAEEKIRITNVLSINDKTKKIQFELNDDELLTCSFDIKFFSFKKDLKYLKGGYVFYIKNV